ncbi:arsenate reductase (glutaredoxin) [Bowmanella dokdonensis]|uniref:Arsenate reductase n=1 Tax=Bowmanella dokdonensis TaxID=751969 RepID=A0A939DLC4_9ALTE|nr:arsenate reductase (glutaredoxin) [Bowmanella dokdonensis]MBN7824412.1 arsenate reductase (glutaredoxin) [Bowmanella dokdonensis]
MSQIQILHNPRCSKSRQTLQLLEQRDIKPQVTEYLKTPLKAQELMVLKNKLGLDTFRQMMRIKEELYRELELKQASEERLLQALVEYPVLLERPVVIKGDQARIGRPPEQVLDIL